VNSDLRPHGAPSSTAFKTPNTRSSATAYGLLVNMCYVSRAMAVIRVPNSKTDLEGHLRASAIAPFDRPHAISY